LGPSWLAGFFTATGPVRNEFNTMPASPALTGPEDVRRRRPLAAATLAVALAASGAAAAGAASGSAC
jgi:hypothetical protein